MRSHSLGSLYDSITLKNAIEMAKKMLVRKTGGNFLTNAQIQLLQILDPDSGMENRGIIPETGDMNVQENIENDSPANLPDSPPI